MATSIWTGNSLNTKQVTQWTFGGTWIADEEINITINGKTIVVLAGATSVATIIATVRSALAAETDADFTAITWTEDSTDTVIGTSLTAGIPFTAVFATDSVSGTITASTPTANKSQYDWSNTDCWDGSIPANTDTVKIGNSSVPIIYGLDQSAVTLTRMDILASFAGRIGQPRYGAAPAIGSFKGTAARYLNIAPTLLNIGAGEGAGSDQIYLDSGSAQLTAVINKTAVPTGGETYAVKLLGSHASNVVTVNRGRVGIADEPGQTATVATLHVGQMTNPADSIVFVGSGVTLTTLNATGGTTILESGATNINVYGGTVELAEGDYGTVKVFGGTVRWMAAGTITTLQIYDTGVVDCTHDLRSRTVTNAIEMSKGATIDDRYGTINTPFTISPQNCDIADLIIRISQNVDAVIGS